MTPSSMLEMLGQSLLPETREVRELGDILLDDEVISAETLALARARQDATGERLRDILVAQGWADPEKVANAVTRQLRLGHADLSVDPPDPAACDPTLLDVYLRHRIVPWRKLGNLVCFAIAEPDDAPQALAEIAPPHAMAFVVIASQRAIDQALLNLMPRETADRAAMLTPEPMSVRGLDHLRWALMAGLGLAAAAALLVPQVMLALMAALLFGLNALTTVTRSAACLASLRHPRDGPDREGAVVLAERRKRPTVTLLVPLYDEAGMLPGLVRALSALDYPRERLDVKLLLEEDDATTRSAVEAANLPPWITPLVVPAGQPRTKPRALNVALDFADGDIVGILDAEDRPDPGQLAAVAAHMAAAPPEVACVQCQLSWFNARESWITRCFQIEYSIWFDVLLRGFQRLGLPIPLGGTSVYFRRWVLHEVGGWDAHNVTEDADLGMRLARRGFQTDVLTSTTEEEANTQILPWVRQRSRWLKGYVMTWLCHMRAPGKLWRELGPLGFVGLNVLFLGGAVTYLAMPLFWIALGLSLSTGTPVFGGALPVWAQAALGAAFALGQAVMLGCAALALWRRQALDLLLWIPILPLYWTLGAVAAWKAIIEVGMAPFYWDKTRHGISRLTPPR